MGFPCGLAGKESACNIRDPDLIPGSGRSTAEWIKLPTPEFLGFPGGSDREVSDGNVGDLGSIPGSGISPGGRNGNPCQYSCLENSMDRGAWWATVHGVAELDMTERLHFTSIQGESHPPGLLLCSFGLLQVFPGGSVVKNPGDASSIPGLGRSPGEGSGNPLQYSCLENPMGR